MIQDIYPHKLYNEYREEKPDAGSRVVFFSGREVLVATEMEVLSVPGYEEVHSLVEQKGWTLRYLFKIDEEAYFLAETEEQINLSGYAYESTQITRRMGPMEVAYALTTAMHLRLWYQNNRFCGRCGDRLEHDHVERMLSCPKCHNMIYPRISPSVIVGVVNGDKILVTKYAGRDYKKYALVAGFTEIGETVEETVAREVMEETGVKVKNIHYYKNQPWGFTGGLLLGYWAQLDGDDTITLDTQELAEGRWMTREELILDDSQISLTREMMSQFKEGKEYEDAIVNSESHTC